MEFLELVELALKRKSNTKLGLVLREPSSMFSANSSIFVSRYTISYTGNKPAGESSVSVLYIGYMKSRFDEVLLNHLDEIDDTLWVILDPEKRKLSLDLLQREFKYPDGNRMFFKYYRRRVEMGF